MRPLVLIGGERAEGVVLNGATITYGRQFAEQIPTPASAYLTLVPLDTTKSLPDLYPGMGFVESDAGYTDTYDDVYGTLAHRLVLGADVVLKVWDGVNETIRFKGVVSALDYRTDSIAVTVVSMAEALTRITLLPAAWPSESEVARVQRIAGHANFPIYIEGANTATISAYPTGDQRVSVWDLLSQLASDCNAVLYANRNGDVVYRTRAADTGRTVVSLAPQGVLSDTLEMQQEVGTVRNTITVTYPTADENVDPGTLTVEDADSIAKYGKRMFDANVMLSKESAQAYADRVLALWKEPVWLMPQATVVVPLSLYPGPMQQDLAGLVNIDLDDEVALPVMPGNAPVESYISRVLGWRESLDLNEWTIQFALDPNGWTWRPPGDTIPVPPVPSPSRNPQLAPADMRGRFRVTNYDGNLTYVTTNISGGGTAVLDAGRGEFTVDSLNSVWEVRTTTSDADVLPGLMERRQYTYHNEDHGYYATVSEPFSYPARAETVQVGTTQVQGDNQTPICPGGWTYIHVEWPSTVWCRNNTNNADVRPVGWLSGCPGGWYACGGACCTDQPVYETRYHCDSGGSPSGATCYGMRDTQVWVSNIVSVRDATPTGYTDTGDEWVRSR